jgi:transcriptional regulator with XRE-family HTH domain
VPDEELMSATQARILAARNYSASGTGKRIAALRKARALRLEKAALMLGIDETRLKRLEGGNVLPDADEIRRICAAYGVSYEKLLS